MTDHEHNFRLHCGAFPVHASAIRNDRGLNEAWAVVRCACDHQHEVTLYCVGPWTPEAVMAQGDTDLTPAALMRAALALVRHCEVVENGEVCGSITRKTGLCEKHRSRQRRRARDATDFFGKTKSPPFGVFDGLDRFRQFG